MLDENGFRRKTYDELLTEMEERARELFGADAKTGPLNFLGILLRLFAWFLSITWQVLEKTYLSAYVSTAIGVQLDRLGKLVGKRRGKARPASGTATFTGLPGKLIEIGTEIRGTADTSPVYQTLADLTLNGVGNGTVAIESLESGTASNVGANVLTELVEPDTDIYTVTNPSLIINGLDAEDDFEYREQIESVNTGGGTANIETEIQNVTGVRAATVFENDTMAVVDGMNPKSIKVVVLGGSNEEVGQAVLANKPGGIETMGAVVVNVTDSSGRLKTVKFDRASEVTVHVRVDIKRGDAFPADGMERVELQLIRYIGGSDATGQVYAGLGMGDDVIFSRLIGAVYSVTGVEDLSIEVSTNGTTWTAGNITINDAEVAQTDNVLIGVTVHD